MAARASTVRDIQCVWHCQDWGQVCSELRQSVAIEMIDMARHSKATPCASAHMIKSVYEFSSSSERDNKAEGSLTG